MPNIIYCFSFTSPMFSLLVSYSLYFSACYVISFGLLSLPLSLCFRPFFLSPLVFFCRPVPVFSFLLFRVYLLLWFFLCLFLFCLSSFSSSSRFLRSLVFFGCGLLLECSVSGAVATEYGDLA